MKKDFDEMESFYKNIFFRQFWSDERKESFKETLNKILSDYKMNREIGEDLLMKATDALFSEEYKDEDKELA